MEWLLRREESGAKIEFMFFGNRGSPASPTSESLFRADGFRFFCADQYLMVKKAELFGDTRSLTTLLGLIDPDEALRLGRRVLPFDERRWAANRYRIAVAGNLAKFSSTAELTMWLGRTEDRVLVAAYPDDPVWGMGLASFHSDVAYPSRWPGLNLLGFALMDVRDRIRQSSSEPPDLDDRR
jgi:ribA/ribD-fused uncharacterized protein